MAPTPLKRGMRVTDLGSMTESGTSSAHSLCKDFLQLLKRLEDWHFDPPDSDENRENGIGLIDSALWGFQFNLERASRYLDRWEQSLHVGRLYKLNEIEVGGKFFSCYSKAMLDVAEDIRAMVYWVVLNTSSRKATEYLKTEELLPKCNEVLPILQHFFESVRCLEVPLEQEHLAVRELIRNSEIVSQPTESEATGNDDDVTPVVDGPFGFNGFGWNGEKYFGLPPTAFRLVSFLWHRKKRKADFQDLVGPVFTDHSKDVTDDLVGSHRKSANTFFTNNALPFEVITERNSDSGRKEVELRQNPS